MRPEYRNLQHYTLEDLRALVAKSNCPEIEPYAFIRFSNEAITIKSSLESIVPFFKKGIICYHELLPGIEEDGSLAIVEEFVRQNPGFRLVKYPFHVLFQNLEGLYDHLYSSTSKYWLLHTYYQFALEQLKELVKENGDQDTAWFFKVDCDHVYSQKLLEYTKLWCQLEQLNGVNCAYFYKANVRNDMRRDDWHEFNHFHLEKISNDYDHTCIKLDYINTYILVVQAHFADDKALARKKSQIYELQHYKPGYKFLPNKAFVNSLHFDREKFFHYQELNQEEIEKCYTYGCPYNQVDWEKMVKQIPEAAIDPEFFSFENVKRIYQSFNYPKKGEGLKYGRNQFKLEEFLANPDYHPSKFLREHAQRWQERDKITDPAELAALERLEKIIHLFEQENFFFPVQYITGSKEFLHAPDKTAEEKAETTEEKAETAKS
ncbi:hypothetical protein CKF54_05010 [Psittacicella hinzii]|uniref:Uncharacterized protein n=1 Tax=Psittacicella hinzii TaxID=2028575 RepID=A0A3A1Y4R2_9GAMM|nr:hypothetical protein [Psittacicella hinzii]RIY32380.1 hypothetical protein CKF54_05010 [Psittacicella hinzii]